MFFFQVFILFNQQQLSWLKKKITRIENYQNKIIGFKNLFVISTKIPIKPYIYKMCIFLKQTFLMNQCINQFNSKIYIEILK